MAAIKFSKQNIQPNPLEVDYWVDITSNPYGGNIKYYNGYDWVDLLNSKGTPINLDAYYNKVLMNQMLAGKASVESVDSKVDDTEVADVIKNIEFKDRGDEGVEMVVLKYNDMTVGVTLPVASNTTSGIITNKSFKDLVKQNQLQGVYSEMYDKLSEIRQQYQRKLKAGKNIQIDSDNTIHAVGEISLDWDDVYNKPDFDKLFATVALAIQSESTRAKNAEQQLSARITDHVDVVESKLELKADANSVYTKDQIDEKISGVYKIKGSRKFQDLPTSGNNIGDVYNITNDFSLDGVEYPFGTNVVYTATGWDALAGIFDSTEIENKVDEIDTKIDEEVIRAKEKELELDEKFDNYLPLSGGTLYNRNHTPLFIDGNDVRSTIAYRVKNGVYCHLGVNNSGTWFATDAGWQNAHELLTSNNYSNYALPLTGGKLIGDLQIGEETTDNTAIPNIILWKGDGVHSHRSLLGTVNDGTSLSYYCSTAGKYGRLKINETGMYFTTVGDGSVLGHKIWHEGNDGEGSGLDADMLDGFHSGYFAKSLSDVGANNTKSNVLGYTYSTEAHGGASAGGLISAGMGTYGMQLNGASGGDKLSFRGFSPDRYTDWKTIAFTDSDIKGNAATATKLATPVKLWGNDFDGSNNIEGNLNDVGMIYFNKYGGDVIYNIDSEIDGFERGFSFKNPDGSHAGYIGAYGEKGVLKYLFLGKNYTNTYLTVLPNGNIGIGTTNPQYELDVNGTASIAGNMTVKTNLNVWNDLAVGSNITSGDLVDWYGVSWSENDSDPTCTRIGNAALHRSLPILNAMKGYWILNRHSQSKNADQIMPINDNWTYLKYPEASNNSELSLNNCINGGIFIKIPEFWYIDDYEPSTKTHNLKISQTAKAGWCHHKESYVGAYEGYSDGTCYKSIKNVIPTVSVSRTTLRPLARANGYEDEYKWNIYTYEEHRAICHLFLVEYATRNSQLAVNTTLTADGFKQGGLGSGCTTGTVTINGQTTYSFIPTGTTDSLGNGSGQVAYTVTQTDADGNEIGTVTRYANRYRGIENPFGHIWKHVDDIVNVYNAETTYKTVYKCNKPEHFATNKNAKYKPLCSFPGGSKMQGWSKEIKATINCDFFKYSVGGSESTYWCDYNYDNNDTSEHGLLIGGRSGYGGKAGLFSFTLADGVGHSYVSIGSRLTYLPWAE